MTNTEKAVAMITNSIIGIRSFLIIMEMIYSAKKSTSKTIATTPKYLEVVRP